MTDALTGAHNRRYFMRQLAKELKEMRRTGADLSLLLMDIDHFKRVNDRDGHAVGDEVLVEFVRRIGQGLTRDLDWCARLGGEESAVVLPQTGLEGAATVAEKLREQVASTPITTAAGPISVTASFGVSTLGSLHSTAEPTAELLLGQADRGLYASKSGGRNRITLPGRGV